MQIVMFPLCIVFYSSHNLLYTLLFSYIKTKLISKTYSQLNKYEICHKLHFESQVLIDDNVSTTNIINWNVLIVNNLEE